MQHMIVAANIEKDMQVYVNHELNKKTYISSPFEGKTEAS